MSREEYINKMKRELSGKSTEELKKYAYKHDIILYARTHDKIVENIATAMSNKRLFGDIPYSTVGESEQAEVTDEDMARTPTKSNQEKRDEYREEVMRTLRMYGNDISGLRVFAEQRRILLFGASTVEDICKRISDEMVNRKYPYKSMNNQFMAASKMAGH